MAEQGMAQPAAPTAAQPAQASRPGQQFQDSKKAANAAISEAVQGSENTDPYLRRDAARNLRTQLRDATRPAHVEAVLAELERIKTLYYQGGEQPGTDHGTTGDTRNNRGQTTVSINTARFPSK